MFDIGFKNITMASTLIDLMEITSWQFGIETETSINMFQTFPKFRKPEDSADRQFPCLGNDMETSTQVSQLSYMWDTKGIMTLIDSVCGNDWETTIVVSKHGKPLGNH